MSLTVQHVPIAHIMQTLPLVKHHIAAGLEHTDDCTVEQAQVFLASGQWLLYVATDAADKLHGVFVVAVTNGPNDRTATVISAGGRGIANHAVFDQLCDLLLIEGATRVQAFARDSAARLFEKSGLIKKANLVERKLWAA
jgi:hypothetical protein